MVSKKLPAGMLSDSGHNDIKSCAVGEVLPLGALVQVVAGADGEFFAWATEAGKTALGEAVEKASNPQWGVVTNIDCINIAYDKGSCVPVVVDGRIVARVEKNAEIKSGAFVAITNGEITGAGDVQTVQALSDSYQDGETRAVAVEVRREPVAQQATPQTAPQQQATK